MIKANELRIDNWVNYKGYGQVNLYWGDVLNIKFYKDFKPIPLTPEILEKGGFVYKATINGQHYWENKITITQTNYHEGYKEYELLNNPVPINKIEHLHQLQNLYFCLTGTELTVNLFEQASLSA